MQRLRRSRALGVVALALIALAWGSMMEDPGPNQNAHLALVTSLADGSPRIDPYWRWSRDIAYIDGHFYTAKAPGLDLVAVPWYLMLDAAGAVPDGPPKSVPWPRSEREVPRSGLWQVAVFGAMLPVFLLLLVVRALAERLAPGYGTAAAVALAAGSLVGVFSNMFFAHALSAALGFGAFALLVRERARPPDLRLVAAAGAVAGYAVVTEFPLAIVALAVGIFAIVRRPWRRRALAYAGGFLVGLLPLLAFNTWAFGSPATLAYTNAVITPGRSGHDVVGANSSGVFGLGVPNPRDALELLFAAKGLLVLTPVWALACAGLVVMWRRGLRAESILVGGIAVAFLVYDAGYYLPFAGFQGGPRLLVPILPFLALPLALIWRSFPLTTTALALASITVTSASIAADPLLVAEDAASWFHRLEHGVDTNGGPVSQTVLHSVWHGGRLAQVLILLGVALAGVLLAGALTPFRFDARDAALAVAGLAAWRVVYVGAPIMLKVERLSGGWTGATAVAALAVVVPLALALLARGNFLAAVPALAVVPLAWPDFAAHTGVALTAVTVALAGLGALLARQRLAVAWPASPSRRAG